MHTVTLDGVEYTKATEVAKQFGYTSDYLGQLCRAKKVNARLVGRSWFLNIPSLQKHQDTRYKNTDNQSEKEASNEPVSTVTKPDTAIKTYAKRVLSPKPRLKKIQRSAVDSKLVHDTIHPVYAPDDEVLLPKVGSNPKVTLLKVSVAEAEKLHIESADSQVKNLTPSPLPEVVLSGSIGVQAVPDQDLSEEIDAEKEDHVSKKSSGKRDLLKNKSHSGKRSLRSSRKNRRHSGVAEEVVSRESGDAVQGAAVSEKNEPGSKLQIKNVDMTQSPEPEELAVTGETSVVSAVKFDFRVQAVAAVLGVLVGVFVLSAEQVLFVGDLEDFSIKFTWSNVKNLASVLFTG